MTGTGAPDPRKLDTDLVEREWSAYIEPLRQLAARHANQLTRPGDPQLRQEYYQAIFSYDWFGEADGRLAIERLGVPAARQRRTAGELETDLAQLATWTEGNIIATLDFAELARKNKVNRLENLKLDIDANGFFGKPDQFYAYGGFALGPGEALLIEAAVPEKVGYWNIQVGDDIGFTWDWMSRQTSLNGFTTTIDHDRVARFVISAEDPGVPNWLDTMGYLSGTICSRWEGCSAPPDEYLATKVALSDLRQHLPLNTPVVSAGERDAAIRRRRRGAQLRKRW